MRKVLGNHVEQAGQLVNDKSVRFDFTHFSALTNEELAKVEDIVNNVILSATVTESKEMPINEAKKLGAMALFGEKYGDVVRVVSVGDVSVEFCGGTHVDNAGKIGLFHIVSESGIASGVRRIEALTGFNTLNLLNYYYDLSQKAASVIKCGNVEELVEKVVSLNEKLKSAEKELDKLKGQLASGKTEDIIKGAVLVGGVKVATAKLSGVTADDMRKMLDTIRDKYSDAVVALASVSGEKLTLCVGCGKDAVTKGAMAGNIVKQIAELCGGNGGGKPDFAMAGGKDISKVDEALSSVQNIVKDMVK
ncbi:MAG: DHHA1 domain-containing protein [Methanocorpusculum sp.]|nr:DHHA1 domain-containing protein [Methanocorpusculum sp.]